MPAENSSSPGKKVGATTYTLGCCDCHGDDIGEQLQIGARKNRVFDPTGDPRYKAEFPLPCEITLYDEKISLTHLRFADGYQPTSTDKYVTSEQGVNYQRHTMIMEVGARKWPDMIIAARFFGRDSALNRNSFPYENTSRAHTVAASIDIGCQQVEKLIKKKCFIKQLIILTSEAAICEGVQKVWDWLRGGFPKNMKDDLTEMDFKLLHFNISRLEERGIEVLFWLVKPEYITDAHFDCICERERIKNVQRPRDGLCTCGRCIAGQQHREMGFAKRGTEPCPCQPCKDIVAKYGHLRRGETFPFTNNAGIKIDLTMEADGANALKEGRKAVDGLKVEEKVETDVKEDENDGGDIKKEDSKDEGDVEKEEEKNEGDVKKEEEKSEGDVQKEEEKDEGNVKKEEEKEEENVKKEEESDEDDAQEGENEEEDDVQDGDDKMVKEEPLGTAAPAA